MREASEVTMRSPMTGVISLPGEEFKSKDERWREQNGAEVEQIVTA